MARVPAHDPRPGEEAQALDLRMDTSRTAASVGPVPRGKEGQVRLPSRLFAAARDPLSLVTDGEFGLYLSRSSPVPHHLNAHRGSGGSREQPFHCRRGCGPPSWGTAVTTPLRILFIEDSEDDVRLLARQLRQGGYSPAYERVETADGLRSALHRGGWDVIISDYST